MNELAILIIAFGFFLNQGQNLENLDFESLPDGSLLQEGL